MLEAPQPRDPAWPRYSRRAFPGYRHLPGHTPHPLRDPRGHSYGRGEGPPARFAAGSWSDSDDYRYGIDLFNFAYWWECHEVLEGVWAAAGRRSEAGRFVRGLIQAAAAQLKRHLGQERAARSLLARALDRIEARRGTYLGIDVDAFASALRSDRSALIRLELPD